MKTDVKGCSTTVNGECYETFTHRNKTYYQYDYRHESGKLFSCVKDSIERCRAALSIWMVQNNLA